MSKQLQRTKGQPALDLIEEAIHLLRGVPMATHVCYLLGTLPFLLGVLYFWADMSQSAFAESRLGSSALGMALLFLWMRTWQTVFLSKLREQIAGGYSEPWTVRRWFRALLQQGAVQPWGLFVLPLALVITLPFGWVYAFFQNYTVLADGTTGGIKAPFRRAVTQAQLWQAQNHVMLVTLFFFGFFIFLNVLTAIFLVPGLIKTFLGIETVFTLSGGAVYNSTLLFAAIAFVYLCMDPLVKAFYVLRCFYGESLISGEDLRVELRSVPRLKNAAAVVLLILICSGAAVAQQSSAEPPPAVRTSDLNESIERTIAKKEYAWRLPREASAELAEQNWIDRTIASVRDTMRQWALKVRDVMRGILEWMEKAFGRKKPPGHASAGSGSGWLSSIQWLLYVLITVLAAVIGVLIYRLWKQRRRAPETIHAEAIPAVPNLESEDVSANQLPEDGWMRLAREMMERGELRLALRALYLASLAHLAQREFVSIARFKSNRDYAIELSRRARSLPDLQQAFVENVHVFDRVWYGQHEVTGEALQLFLGNLERIRGC